MSSHIKQKQGALALAALGVVYGDIGTSPLYAFKEAFTHGMPLTEANVLATLSAFFWALFLIVAIKYVWVVIRFDNEGEGGVLALTALAQRLAEDKHIRSSWLVGAGIFAAALFYADSFLTPAVSVLSAVEGVGVLTSGFEGIVVPLTIVILFGLFLVQRYGTQKIGGLFFGPIMVVWFVSLAVMGIHSIVQTPVVLHAINPMYALQLAIHEPKLAFILLAAVFLGLTGGEALYADMGHFGARAIRLAWYGLVWPSLLLNYFGQGALVLRSPEAVSNPFYMLAPGVLMVWLVFLATCATVIASQATIAGAYSMTLQAARLKFLPRLNIMHTSDFEKGQIYVPSINWVMLVAVVALVLGFGSSSALAAAYGIAVSGTMMITTVLLAFIVLHTRSRYKMVFLFVLGIFAIFEVLFLSSNLTKVESGGWLPLVVGSGIYVLLTVWRKGSQLLDEQRRAINIPMDVFLNSSFADVPRVSGTAVYLTSDLTLVPSALFHNLKHYKVMHEKVIFLNVTSPNVPYIAESHRLQVEEIAPNVFNIRVNFGFREETDVAAALSQLPSPSLYMDPMNTTYFLARSTLVDGLGGLNRWRFAVFSGMFRQAESVTSSFNLPPNRVVELGAQVSL
ncbi:Low affinity potassium transport system protein kup [Ephemeroptericola cinctiostellae]|uniref:Probable potassium transport system protein Kup n=1 Tax=Ephemeroptericola cinctiostellae TaxID=2268024 RepID=A0A345D7K3_9BURK|nr:KUP/HAK/KT family potassium transporter [Ephemeroptericola cinctiostellae]AXF84341.1 Low affinity potassium transport system protein kup [Ephemeroptericola cinctiostellae]